MKLKFSLVIDSGVVVAGLGATGSTGVTGFVGHFAGLPPAAMVPAMASTFASGVICWIAAQRRRL